MVVNAACRSHSEVPEVLATTFLAFLHIRVSMDLIQSWKGGGREGGRVGERGGREGGREGGRVGREGGKEGGWERGEGGREGGC